MKDKASDPADSIANTINYLRSATATLIPGSAPFLTKIFDQIENISKEHGDDAKRIFDETYKDFEKLAKEGGLDSQTASKAVDILQKRVKELQELAGGSGGAGGDADGDAYNKLISENPKLKDQISEQYDKLKEVVEKAKEKKPEAQKLLKETSSELTKIFKDDGVSKEAVKKAQDLLKKKAEEAKKLGEEITKDAKEKK